MMLDYSRSSLVRARPQAATWLEREAPVYYKIIDQRWLCRRLLVLYNCYTQPKWNSWTFSRTMSSIRERERPLLKVENKNRVSKNYFSALNNIEASWLLRFEWVVQSAFISSTKAFKTYRYWKSAKFMTLMLRWKSKWYGSQLKT